MRAAVRAGSGAVRRRRHRAPAQDGSARRQDTEPSSTMMMRAPAAPSPHLRPAGCFFFIFTWSVSARAWNQPSQPHRCRPRGSVVAPWAVSVTPWSRYGILARADTRRRPSPFWLRNFCWVVAFGWTNQTRSHVPFGRRHGVRWAAGYTTPCQTRLPARLHLHCTCAHRPVGGMHRYRRPGVKQIQSVWAATGARLSHGLAGWPSQSQAGRDPNPAPRPTYTVTPVSLSSSRR